MLRLRCSPFALLAALIVTVHAAAQSVAPEPSPPDDAEPAAAEASPPDETEPAATEASRPDDAEPTAPTLDYETEDASAAPASGLTAICDIDPAACPRIDLAAEAAKDLPVIIYAVTGIYAKRKRRFEFNPYFSISLNDQFVQHPGVGVGASYFVAEVLAVVGGFDYYRTFNIDSDFNADVRRAARISVPLSEYAWGASFGLQYVAGHGKFTTFGDFIFHWDVSLGGGAGLLNTRPIAVIDPENRAFAFTPKAAAYAGIGTRIFFNRWFASSLEIRDHLFQDRLESLETPIAAEAAQDPTTWYGERELVNHVQARLGVALFVPFKVKYHLPR